MINCHLSVQIGKKALVIYKSSETEWVWKCQGSSGSEWRTHVIESTHCSCPGSRTRGGGGREAVRPSNDVSRCHSCSYRWRILRVSLTLDTRVNCESFNIQALQVTKWKGHTRVQCCDTVVHCHNKMESTSFRRPLYWVAFGVMYLISFFCGHIFFMAKNLRNKKMTSQMRFWCTLFCI